MSAKTGCLLFTCLSAFLFLKNKVKLELEWNIANFTFVLAIETKSEERWVKVSFFCKKRDFIAEGMRNQQTAFVFLKFQHIN